MYLFASVSEPGRVRVSVCLGIPGSLVQSRVADASYPDVSFTAYTRTHTHTYMRYSVRLHRAATSGCHSLPGVSVGDSVCHLGPACDVPQPSLQIRLLVLSYPVHLLRPQVGQFLRGLSWSHLSTLEYSLGTCGRRNSIIAFFYRIWSLLRVLAFVAIATSPLGDVQQSVGIIFLVIGTILLESFTEPRTTPFMRCPSRPAFEVISLPRPVLQRSTPRCSTRTLLQLPGPVGGARCLLRCRHRTPLLRSVGAY